MTHTGTTQPSRSGRPRHLDDADQPTLDPTPDVGSSGAGGLHPSDPDAVVSSHATVPPGTTVAPDATVPPTPPPGTPRPTPAAPRGRRRDHLLTAVVGAALVPVLLELGSRALAAASPEATGGPHPVRALAWLVTAFVVLGLTQILFARRSSVGNLTAGLTGLAVEAAVLADAATGWPHASDLTDTGAVLAVGALLLGGAWGMRRARRAGRAEARLAARLSLEDREIGVAPVAPPSRRSDHLLTLVACLTMTGVAARLLPPGHETLLAGTGTEVTALLVGAATALLVSVTAFAGLSTLGARASGIVGLLLALPALLDGRTPGRTLLDTVLAHGPAPATVLLVSMVLIAVAWGAHLARREGRAAERTTRQAASV